jgi:UDP-2,3-diacylglucosamine pyrophosphatase LpxH
MKNKYRSVFVSDIHLGSPKSQDEKLLAFLETTKTEYLYIVGDFIDFFHLYEHHGWSKKCNLIIRRLLSKVRKGTQINLCFGNHDAFLGILNSFQFGEVNIQRQFIHHNQFTDYLVTHGDQYDYSLRHTAVVKMLAFFYTHFHSVPLIGCLKKLAYKIALHNMNMKKMMYDIKKVGVNGCIFGHTHKPEMKFPFMNCGDWTDHCTAIIEDYAGEFHLINHDHTKYENE